MHMLHRRAADCGRLGLGLVGFGLAGGGCSSFSTTHLGALGSCVLGPGTSLPTGFYWAQPLPAFALKGRFAFQSAGTPAGEGGQCKPPTPAAAGTRHWVTPGSTGDPVYGPFVAAGSGDTSHEDAPREHTPSLQPSVPQKEGALGKALLLKPGYGQRTNWAVPAISTDVGGYQTHASLRCFPMPGSSIQLIREKGVWWEGKVLGAPVFTASKANPSLQPL